MPRPPAAVTRAMREGLELVEAGHAGRGLRPSTVREARAAVSAGTVSEEKARRMRAWLARHGASPAEVAARKRDRTSPARVAWLLWGGDAAVRWLR